MSDNSYIELDSFQSLLDRFEIYANPSEIHGMLTGLLCGGTKLSNPDWLAAVSDFYHQGLKFHEEVVLQLELLFRRVFEALSDDHMQFRLMLPSDEEALTLRAKALSDWAQGFLLGFGVNQQVLERASDEVNEAIKDFAEISKMASDVDENDEENENAFAELHEYVRISTIMCFLELGDINSTKDKITLH